ncbi:MAG: TIGR00730 family Rossman fold protein [Planctomycetaceae bacterium]|nr:TIGR00730 family Rossman fold protein [Planctomycetaceae bacterium]
MARICVFCGSRSGDSDEFAAAAEKVGTLLAACGHTLVYGGGSTGIMGVLANAVLRAGGNIIGVIPEHLARPELMHDKVQDMRITADMHERKAVMHSLADAYIALPGGYGTLEELFEAVTWAQLDLHTREVAVLNVCGLFDGLCAMLDKMTDHGFLSADCRRHLRVYLDSQQLLDWLSRLGETR